MEIRKRGIYSIIKNLLLSILFWILLVLWVSDVISFWIVFIFWLFVLLFYFNDEYGGRWNPNWKMHTNWILIILWPLYPITIMPSVIRTTYDLRKFKKGYKLLEIQDPKDEKGVFNKYSAGISDNRFGGDMKSLLNAKGGDRIYYLEQYVCNPLPELGEDPRKCGYWASREYKKGANQSAAKGSFHHENIHVDAVCEHTNPPCRPSRIMSWAAPSSGEGDRLQTLNQVMMERQMTRQQTAAELDAAVDAAVEEAKKTGRAQPVPTQNPWWWPF